MRLTSLVMLTLSIFMFMGCEPLETGDPPTFSQGFTVTALSASQIEVKWSAGADDFNDPEELRYGIWFADAADDIDLDSSPDIETGEGALGYSLTNLEADTAYFVIVRAFDRGRQFSDADDDDIKTVRTTTDNAGTYGKEFRVNTSIVADGMISGVLLNGARDDIGLIDGNTITWFQAEATGQLTQPTTIQPLNVGAEIRDAYLAKFSLDRAFEDLIVSTSSNFYYYRNTGAGLDNRLEPFGQNIAPDEGSIRINHLNGNFEALSFVVGGNEGFVFTLDQEPSVEVWDPVAATVSLGNNSVMQMADVDNDDDLDIVSFSTNRGLSYFENESDEDNPYDFAGLVAIDSGIARDADEDEFFLVDGNNDGDVDIYIVTANETEITNLRFYEGNGDGTFEAGVDFDFGKRRFEQVQFLDVSSNAGVELVALQTGANNVAIHSPGSNASYTSLLRYLGGRRQVDFFAFGDINNEAGIDLVLYSNQSGNRGFTVIPGAPSMHENEDTTIGGSGSGGQIP